MFSVRLISADSYQAQPVPQLDPTFSAFRGSGIKHVPVIRIFGTTANGEKTCLHVHGVFPYLFVPYTGKEEPEVLAYRLAAALDAAINVSLGSATSNTQHVYSVQRVSGIPFYGYHRKEHQFLKIYFYNPAMIKRAAELLQNGSVLNQSLQPHEAHINYILQFMMDYNIYGMSLVNLRSCKHRRAAQSLAELSSSGQSINSESSDIVYLPNEVERQSTCELEVDAVASDILNRLDIENDLELNPGLAAIWEEERARRAQAGFSGGDSQLVNPKSPTRPPFAPTDHDVYQEQRLARRLLMISQCDESTLSTASHRSVAYAAETRDNENLMNASCLPNVSVQRTERLHQGGQDDSLGDMSFVDSPTNSASQIFTPDSSILGTEDMPLVDLLAQLARETECNPETVDADSLLGSQMSVLDVNEYKSDNEEEEEDVGDLNLTCLELDSLGSIEAAMNRVGKSSQTENPTIERKNKASSVPDASPFLSPCEISSSSAKSPRDNEEAGESDHSRTSRMPQYDGAGDVSPTLLNSDHEDSREIPNNAKDYERLPEYNDFADMRSSMEIGILLSSGDDNEKAESLGESNQGEDDENDDDDPNNDDDLDEDDDSQDALPLESVLNGDPCFTESAELDKSDLAELRDQYVSLLDNALLPEVRDSSRIDSDDLEDSSSTFAVANFETIEKSCPVSPDITSSRGVLVNSRGSTSSLENIAPNVPRPSSIGSDHDDPRSRKDTHVATSNDTADYNCNVVATWEELQNLRIIDKSENERTTSRRRARCGKYVPGPRSKRRGRRSSSLEQGQVVSENAEKAAQALAHSCSSSEPMDGSHKLSVDAKRTSEVFHASEETLSRVFDVTRLLQSPNEDTSGDYPTVSRRDDDAFRRSILDADNPLADVRSTLPGARYSTYPSLHANDSLVEPILADFEETSDDLRDDETETLSDVGAESLSFASYYVPRRSLSHSDVEDRQHRHCFISKHNKIVQDQVFASDQLWIIQRRKRGSINSSLRNVCNKGDCKLPVVFVRKLEETRREEMLVEENAVASIDESFPRPVEWTMSATENDGSRKHTTSEKSVVSPQPPRVRRTRAKREIATAEGTIGSIVKMDSVNEEQTTPFVEPLSRETSVARCLRRHRGAVRTKRDPYDTRRRLHGSQFAMKRRRNARIEAESGEKSRSGRKKARARTKYKEGTLPGIPGIVNHETPVKRRRSRKIALSSNASEDVDSSRTRKRSPSKVASNSSVREDETRYTPTDVAKKSPANGLVPAPRYIDVPPEKLRGQRISAAMPINIAPKGRANSSDDGKYSFRLDDLSGSPEKITDTRQPYGTKILSKSAFTGQKKMPETVTLGLMLQEARSPGTRKALQLLLQKRLSERLEREEMKKERAARKSESSDAKTTETKAPDCVAARKETIVQRAYEVITDKAEVAEPPKILDDGLENSTNSEAPSFETVNDSDANSQNPGDSISIASLDTEICDPVEFDAGTTTLGGEFSVDDAAIVIFDGDTDADSVIVEATSSEEFTNVVKITYDTDRYENAIKEANFFAGINYSIDAVSNEIPTCLFEEDSNSVDKRLPKRTSEVSAESADGIDALSELSVDPRDLDVYDVESLTSTCSVSALDETTDATETSPEMSDEESNVIEDARVTRSNEKSRDQQATINVHHYVDATPEDESNMEDAIPGDESNIEGAISEHESNMEAVIPEYASNFEDAIPEHESNIEGAIPEHESNMEAVIPEYASNFEDAIPEHESNIEDAVPEHESNMEDAIPEHESNVEDAILEHESNMEDAIPEHESNVEDAILEHESNMEDAIPEHESNIEDAIPEQESNVENAILEHESNMEDVIPEDESNIEDAILEHESNIEDAILEHESNIEDAIPEDESNMEYVILEHESNIENVILEHESNMEDVIPEDESNIEDAILEHESNIEDAILEHESNIEDAIPEDESNMEDVILEHESNIEDAIPQHESNIEDAVSDDESNIENTVPEHESNVEDAIFERKSNIEDAILEHESNIEKAIPEPESNIEKAIPEPEYNMEDAIPKRESNIEEAIPEHESNMEDAIPEHKSNIEEAIPEHESNMEDAIPEHKSNIKEAIPEHESKIEDAILERESNIEFTIPEHESSFEEDSPSFEALSPQPRVILTLVPALEEEFTIDCPLESTAISGDQAAMAKHHDDILGTNEHFPAPIGEEKLSLEIDISEDNATENNRSGTANEEFSTTNENSEISSFPNSEIEADTFDGVIEENRINEEDPKVGSEIDQLVSLIDAEPENELEIREKTELPVDAEIQTPNVPMDDAVNEKTSSSTEKENPDLTSSPREIYVSQIVEENAKPSSGETYEENGSPAIAEENDKVSTTSEEARNPTLVEIEKYPGAISRDLPEALPEENEFSASTERQSDEATPVEQEKQLPEIAEDGTEVPVVVEEDGILTSAQVPMTDNEDAELPEPSASALEPSASREDDEQSSSGMREESTSRITVDEQRKVLAQSLIDVESQAIVQKDEELLESNESHVAGSVSVEKENLCSSILEQPCLPVPTETDELSESPQIRESQPENDLPSNNSVQTATRIETDDELPKVVEYSENCEESTDLPPSLQEQSNTHARLVQEDTFSPRERMKVAPTVVQSHEEKAEIIDEKTDTPRPIPADEPSSVTSIVKTAEEKMASISNENDQKLRATVNSALSSADNDADSQVGKRVAADEEAEKVPQQIVNEEETFAEEVEKVAQHSVGEEETIAEEAEKVCEQIVDEEETIAEEAEKVCEQIVDGEETIAEESQKVAEKIVDGEKAISEEAEKVPQQMVDEETRKEKANKLRIEEPFLSQRFETEETQSQVKNDETCEKNPTSEPEVIAGKEEMLENSKNESIDINENEAQSANASLKTTSPCDRACEDEPKVLLECRPVSIKLVNIDLSKIRSFAPRTRHKPTSPDRESSQAMPQDANKEFDEKMAPETSKTAPKNYDDATSVTVEPIVNNLEKHPSTTEAQVHPCNDKVRRRRRRIPKDTRMPERRSVRICAEMTLKLSLKQSPKKSAESTMKCLMPDSSVSELSLERNIARILPKDGSLSEEIRNIVDQPKVARSSSTVGASINDDSPKINEDPTTGSPGQEFTVCQSKTSASQELVLSEQTMANGNAAPTSLKAPKSSRPRKRAQSQEAPSSPRIIDENTAPTSDNPKRKKSQVNLQEALVDFEPSKPLIPEEATRRNVDKTSTGVDPHPAAFLKVAKVRNADLQNLSIKRRRNRPFGCRKIRRRTQDRLSSVSAKNNRDDPKNSGESEESTRTGRRDLTPRVIIALPTLDALKSVPDVGRDEPSLPEESAREVTTEPRVAGRRGRSEKKSDLDKDGDSSTGKNSHSDAEALGQSELTSEKNTEQYVGPVANRRRGRSGKIPEILSTLTSRRSVEIPLQRSEALPGRSEESNEPKTPVVLERRARRGASPETRLASRQSEMSLQRATNTEPGTSANQRHRGRSRKYSIKRIGAFEKISEPVPTEKSSQKPEKSIEKIIERDVESSTLVADTPEASDPSSPPSSLIESDESTLERRIVLENDAATISSVADRENSSGHSSLMRKIAENYREGTTKNVPRKCRPFYRWRRKHRWSRKPRPFPKQLSQGGSSSDETTPKTAKEYAKGSDSLTQRIIDENVDSNTACVRRRRCGKARCTVTVEKTVNEKAELTEPTTQPDGAAIARKTLEERPASLTNSSPMDAPVTSPRPENSTTPKKRVRFDEESIARSAKHCRHSSREISEPCPKKPHKQTEIDSPGSARGIVQEACEKSSDDSSESADIERSTLDSVPLLARLKTLGNDRRDDEADDAKPTDAEEGDGTTFSRRNELFVDLSSYSTMSAIPEKSEKSEISRAQYQRNRKRDIPRAHVSAGSKEYPVHGDDKLRFSRVKLVKSPEPSFRPRNLRGDYTSRCSPGETIAYAQLKRPIILLKRLSRKSLKSYGIAYRPRDRTFVKLSQKSVRRYSTEDEEDENEEFQLPAYDGAADLSSSDEEDPDVTIAREEKRICSYGSARKIAPAKRDEGPVTPKKRKIEVTEEASSPAKKRQIDATQPRNNVTPGKKSYRSSPGGTSTLKTPGGGNARVYSPLKIIVTSPKVRKETLETISSSTRRMEQPEGNANNPSTSSFIDSLANTKARKNSRLHDTVLRGRLLNTAKTSLRELGDKHVTVDKTGSNAVGELDEIRSIGQTERTVNKLRTSIATECHEASSLRDSAPSTTLPDGKDVRKRLLFTDTDNETITDSTITAVHEAPEIQTSREDIERLGGIEDDEGSIEVAKSPKHRGTTIFEAVPGSSRCSDDSRICDYGTKVYDCDDVDDDDDDVCNVTFTQYIESQRSKNETSFSANHETNGTKERITIMPKFKPPSRQRIVDTMEKYGMAKYRNEAPFFSVAADVPRQKELAHRMLGVPGKSIDFLPAFVPSLEGVTGLARWRKMWLNEFHPSLARSKEHAIRLALASSSERIVLTPLVKPPTRKQVKDWLRAREYLARKRNADVEESKRTSKEPDVEETKITSKQSDVEGSTVKLKESEPLETRADEDVRNESDSSDVSVVEPSPERTLVSKDLEKNARSATSVKLAKRTLSKVNPAKSSEKNGSGSRETSNELADPSLMDILEKSRLFRDQEGSRHLGFSRGQIEFLSDSTRSNVTAENLRNVKALTRYQYLTIMCLEVHVATRGDLLPDAQHDPIAAIFYSIQSDVPPESCIKPLEHGVIVLAEDERSKNKMYYAYASRIPWTINFASNEEALLNALVTLITRTDPEILIGWELETLSWGYVFHRASRLGMNLFKRVSRIPATQYKWEFQAPDIETLAEVKLPGRIVLDIWRIMRHEAALLSYTFESVMHHVLNERIPCPPYSTLTAWWDLARARPCRWRVVEHYSTRVLGVFRILDQLDIIGRTSELARLFGIQFYEVFSRGSQFRVESVMLRLAKPLNYIAVSPSSLQRASMRAMEALPLIMEPESMLYSDPLIVLDFQSLYPSIIIAHNYCFSTCLGRIEHIGQPEPFEFGAYTLRVPKRTALKLQGKVNYAPCGVAYVKPEVRLGILPRMLTEILETRFMVKKAMKDHNKEDKTLQRALHSRQMGLKFLANVTYGYTAANFSGRMPCIEVGDSVISKSKETLERAIKLVQTTPKWGARVVYGDTDSLFILVPGKSKDEAFVIGNEIADAVTASNPPPIKLKFEKILYPAILQTKKRYCGYMYETPEQANPTYLAKGIETVRRDGCPAVSKILEKTLKILFETKDVSLVKKYVTRQLDKVLRGKVSIQDLTFAKEFRGLKGYKAKACVPALELTRRLARKDPRAVPRTSERVRYVIVAGAPNQALIHCVRTPWELINDPGLRPNAIYYVTRVIIPPLNRCLNLMGVDVNEWYREMPHRQVLDNPVGQPSDKQKLTIFQYFGTIVCVACGQPSNKGICAKCLGRPADTLVAINEKIRWLDRTNNHVTAICQSCVGQADAADCASLDCPVLYRRAQARRELTQAVHLREIIECGNNLEF